MVPGKGEASTGVSRLSGQSPSGSPKAPTGWEVMQNSLGHHCFGLFLIWGNWEQSLFQFFVMGTKGSPEVLCSLGRGHFCQKEVLFSISYDHGVKRFSPSPHCCCPISTL